MTCNPAEVNLGNHFWARPDLPNKLPAPVIGCTLWNSDKEFEYFKEVFLEWTFKTKLFPRVE